jgi:hypothetical protein
MTCREARALARSGKPSLATAHIECCPGCRVELDHEDRVIALARASLAIEIPAGHAARVVRGALSASAVREPPWWELALPIAWRAAVVLNVAGAIALSWMLARGAPTSSTIVTADTDADSALDDEISLILDGELGVGEGSAP